VGVFLALLLRVYYHFLLPTVSTVETYGIKTSTEPDKNILVKNLAAMSSSSESEDATLLKRRNYDINTINQRLQKSRRFLVHVSKIG